MTSKNAPSRLKSASKRGATQTSRLAKRQRDRQTNRQTDRQTNRPDRQTVKQADNQHTNTQTNRQTDRQKEVEREIHNIYSFQNDTQRYRRKHRERLYCTMIAKDTERTQTANNPCSLFPFHAKPGSNTPRNRRIIPARNPKQPV